MTLNELRQALADADLDGDTPVVITTGGQYWTIEAISSGPQQSEGFQRGHTYLTVPRVEVRIRPADPDEISALYVPAEGQDPNGPDDNSYI